jgi:hypothetical protein
MTDDLTLSHGETADDLMLAIRQTGYKMAHLREAFCDLEKAHTVILREIERDSN